MRIAINGVGVAGPTLAFWLQRYGHEPVLFEKAPALRAQCYEMSRMRMVDPSGRDEATVDLTPMREALHGRVISLARADLAAAAVRALSVPFLAKRLLALQDDLQLPAYLAV